jgi:hypothetical protein
MALPATEDFAGAAGNLSASWTQQRTTRRVQRNGSGAGIQDATDAIDDVIAFWNADAFPNDQYSQVAITALGAGSIIVSLRAADSGDATRDYYEFYTDGVTGAGHTEAAVVVNGGTTVLRNFATTFAASDVMKLGVVGTTLTAYKNGTSLGTQSNSTLTSGAAGVGSYCAAGTRPTFDNWEGGSLGSTSPVGRAMVQTYVARQRAATW